MNIQTQTFEHWPPWLRSVFVAFGGIFLFFLISQMSRITDSLTAWDILPPEGSPAAYVVHGFRALLFSPWTLTFFETIVMLIIARAMMSTLAQGRTRGTATLVILYGVSALLLVILIGVFQSRYKMVFEALQFQQASIIIDQSPQSAPPKDNNLLLYITAISGLITAASAFYGQVISARKLSMELELQRMQLHAAEKKPIAKGKTAGKKRA